MLLNLRGTTYIQEYAEKYAEDQDAFFKDYAESHAKLSSLGSKFEPPEVFSELFLWHKFQYSFSTSLCFHHLVFVQMGHSMIFHWAFQNLS